MGKTKISSTKLKRNTGELLNRVKYGGEEIVVTKGGKDFAVIKPVEEEKSLEEIKKIADKYRGSIPDFPDVVKDRRNRKKKITLD